MAPIRKKDEKPPAWDVPLAVAMVVVAIAFFIYLALNFQSLVVVP